MRVYHPAAPVGRRGSLRHVAAGSAAAASSARKRRRTAAAPSAATAAAAAAAAHRKRRKAAGAGPGTRKKDNHVASGFVVGNAAVQLAPRGWNPQEDRLAAVPVPVDLGGRPRAVVFSSPRRSCGSQCSCENRAGAIHFLLLAGRKPSRRCPKTPAARMSPRASGRSSQKKYAHEFSDDFASPVSGHDQRQLDSTGDLADGAAMDLGALEDTALRISNVRRSLSAAIELDSPCGPEISPPSLGGENSVEPDPPSRSIDPQHFDRMTLLRKEAYDDLARSTQTYNESIVHRMRYLETLPREEQRSIMLDSGDGLASDVSLWMERRFARGNAGLCEDDPEVEELVAMIGSDSVNVKDYAELLEFEDGLVKHTADEAHWVGDLW